MKLHNYTKITFFVLVLMGCEKQEEDKKVSEHLENSLYSSELVCSKHEKSCSLEVSLKSDSSFVLSDSFTIPWGYHTPGLSLEFEDCGQTLVISIDHDYGEGIIVKSFEI